MASGGSLIRLNAGDMPSKPFNDIVSEEAIIDD